MPNQDTRAPRGDEPRMGPQSGLIMIYALIAGVVVLGMIFSGNLFLQASSQGAAAEYRRLDQAVDVARAGLVDGHAWFRRQVGQPVKAFAPERDFSKIPPINDTDDPTIGLVREFEFAADYVGRYEIRKWIDLDGNGRADVGEGVADVSAQRGLNGQGIVWQLESWGFVYKRVDPNKAWDEEPNYRVAGALMSTEIRQISLSPPAKAALCVAIGGNVEIGVKGSIYGGDETGIAYAPATGTPTLKIGSIVEGAPPTSEIPGYDGSVKSVFGVSLEELKSMATVRLAAGHPLPSPMPEYALVYIESEREIDGAAPLRGSGVVIVNGNLLILPGNDSYFTGLIYVTGNLELRAPSLIRGAMIVAGSVNISGTGDKAELMYDAGVIAELRLEMGGYRITRPLLRVDPALIGGMR